MLLQTYFMVYWSVSRLTQVSLGGARVYDISGNRLNPAQVQCRWGERIRSQGLSLIVKTLAPISSQRFSDMAAWVSSSVLEPQLHSLKVESLLSFMKLEAKDNPPHYVVSVWVNITSHEGFHEEGTGQELSDRLTIWIVCTTVQLLAHLQGIVQVQNCNNGGTPTSHQWSGEV